MFALVLAAFAAVAIVLWRRTPSRRDSGASIGSGRRHRHQNRDAVVVANVHGMSPRHAGGVEGGEEVGGASLAYPESGDTDDMRAWTSSTPPHHHTRAHARRHTSPSIIYLEEGDLVEAEWGRVHRWHPRQFRISSFAFGIPNVKSLAPFRDRVNPSTGEKWGPPIVAFSKLHDYALPVRTYAYDEASDRFVLNAEGQRRRKLLERMWAGEQVRIPGTAPGSTRVQYSPDKSKRQQLCLKRFLLGYDENIYVNRLTDFAIESSKQAHAQLSAQGVRHRSRGERADTKVDPTGGEKASWLNESYFNTKCIIQDPKTYVFNDMAMVEAYTLFAAPFYWSAANNVAFNPTCLREAQPSRVPDKMQTVFMPGSGTCEFVSADKANTRAFKSQFCPPGQSAYHRTPTHMGCCSDC